MEQFDRVWGKPCFESDWWQSFFYHCTVNELSESTTYNTFVLHGIWWKLNFISNENMGIGFHNWREINCSTPQLPTNNWISDHPSKTWGTYIASPYAISVENNLYKWASETLCSCEVYVDCLILLVRVRPFIF